MKGRESDVDLDREIVRCEIERSASEAEFLRTGEAGPFVGTRDWEAELELVKKEKGAAHGK
jgi:hypothetical protein